MASNPAATDPSSSTSITMGDQPPGEVPRRLAPYTFHPDRCWRSAQASPMPADAPVMRITPPIGSPHPSVLLSTTDAASTTEGTPGTGLSPSAGRPTGGNYMA